MVAWIALLVFDQLIAKHFVLRRLRNHHARLWERMGCPSVFDVLKESHWTLVGFSGDFPLLAEIEDAGAGKTTRRMVLGYRALFGIEGAMAVMLIVLIYMEM